MQAATMRRSLAVAEVLSEAVGIPTPRLLPILEAAGRYGLAEEWRSIVDDVDDPDERVACVRAWLLAWEAARLPRKNVA